MRILRPLTAVSLLLLALMSATLQAQESHCEINYAGQTIAVGSVCVTVNETSVDLDYFMENGWTLSEAHAWIGDNLANLPTGGGGNPQIGQFPHAASNLGGVTHYNFNIPISQLNINADEFCGSDLFVAAHGVVSKAGASSGGGSGGSDGGKSDKSGKSGQSGKSDKSGQSGKSDKSDKSGKSSKSDKSGQSGKSSDKSGKSSAKSSSSSNAKAVSNSKSKGRKGAVTSSKGKGSSGNAKAGSSSSKSDKSDKSGQSGKSSDKSGKSGQSGKSDKSGKSGQSGKSDKSDKSGKSGAPSNPGTQTESSWAGTIQINSGGSWATYFGLQVDCGEPPPCVTDCPEPPCETDCPEPPCETNCEEPPPVDPDAWLPSLPQGCSHAFASGATGLSFHQAGLAAEGSSGWLFTPTGAPNDTLALTAGGQHYGTLYAESDANNLYFAYVGENDWLVSAVNIYVGSLGSFNSIVPSTYSHNVNVLQVTGGNLFSTSMLIVDPITMPADSFEYVAHAVMCTASVTTGIN